MPKTFKVLFVAHSQTEFNKANLYTGWCDARLTEMGIEEAKYAGILLKGTHFDEVHTSCLHRATETVNFILKETKKNVPVISCWRLNDKHYGAFSGLTKEEAANIYDKSIVDSLALIYHAKPPTLEPNNVLYRQIYANSIYATHPLRQYIPNTESFKDLHDRVTGYWNTDIIPRLQERKTVLIVSHEKVLRCLVKYLTDMPVKRFMSLCIPRCMPFYFEFGPDMKPTPNGIFRTICDF